MTKSKKKEKRVITSEVKIFRIKIAIAFLVIASLGFTLGALTWYGII